MAAQNGIASLVIPAVHMKYVDSRMCCSNRTVLCQIILSLSKHDWTELDSGLTEGIAGIRELLYTDGIRLLSAGVSETWMPGIPEYMQATSQCLLSLRQATDTDLLKIILDSSFYEVRLTGLEYICDELNTRTDSNQRYGTDLLTHIIAMMLCEPHPECLELVSKNKMYISYL